MEARIKPELNRLSNKMVFAVVTKGGIVARFSTRAEASSWAIQNGYTLRYSGN